MWPCGLELGAAKQCKVEERREGRNRKDWEKLGSEGGWKRDEVPTQHPILVLAQYPLPLDHERTEGRYVDVKPLAAGALDLDLAVVAERPKVCCQLFSVHRSCNMLERDSPGIGPIPPCSQAGCSTLHRGSTKFRAQRAQSHTNPYRSRKSAWRSARGSETSMYAVSTCRQLALALTHLLAGSDIGNRDYRHALPGAREDDDGIRLARVVEQCAQRRRGHADRAQVRRRQRE